MDALRWFFFFEKEAFYRLNQHLSNSLINALGLITSEEILEISLLEKSFVVMSWIDMNAQHLTYSGNIMQKIYIENAKFRSVSKPCQ